jgi:hypothetical protein
LNQIVPVEIISEKSDAKESNFNKMHEKDELVDVETLGYDYSEEKMLEIMSEEKAKSLGF